MKEYDEISSNDISFRNFNLQKTVQFWQRLPTYTRPERPLPTRSRSKRPPPAHFACKLYSDHSLASFHKKFKQRFENPEHSQNFQIFAFYEAFVCVAWKSFSIIK